MTTALFTADFSGSLDIRPSDEVMMTLAYGRDRVTQQADAFSLSARNGSPAVGGFAIGFRPFEVRLIGPGGRIGPSRMPSRSSRSTSGA